MITGNETAMPVEPGLTIRQHFAALAMQSLVATTNTRVETLWSKILRLFGSREWHVKHELNIQVIARVSAEIADALIAELNKTQK